MGMSYIHKIGLHQTRSLPIHALSSYGFMLVETSDKTVVRFLLSLELAVDDRVVGAYEI